MGIDSVITISVIIPVYNVRSYLRQCLDSVINQTYPFLEIIIIDDGSTDGSDQICEEIAELDSRVQVIHTENHGLATARNIGITKATGSYITFVDSDDWCESNLIEAMLNSAPGTDIVIVRSCCEYIGKTVYPKDSDIYSYKGGEILEAFIQGAFRSVVWNKLFRSDVYKDIRFPDGHNYEDTYTTWRILKRVADKNGRVVVLPDVMIHQRMRRSSITHNYSFHNRSDRWAANICKFEGLCDDRLIEPCICAIGGVWLDYCGYKEKKEAAVLLNEMNLFAREYFFKVIKGKYSKKTKLICAVTIFKSPTWMRLCYLGGKVYRKKKNEYELYE